ncbi:MAG: ion transporter [Thermodesulfobacteria bacterium]|nr:ion transporter [Thermodesulfobacteriota bacterium]
MKKAVAEYFDSAWGGVANKLVSGFLVIIIFTSSICLVLTTEPSIEEKYGYYLWLFEAFSSFVFMVEYLLRVWSCPEETNEDSCWKVRFRYIFSFMGMVDLLSFLPFVLLVMGWSQTPQLMLLQLLRLLKLTRYSVAFDLLADVLKDEAESLLVSVMLMFIILIFASVGIFIFEHDVQPDAFGSIPKAMWWAIVTLTTVGYGDVTPITVQGKIFATFITVAGVGLVSLPAGIIASGFTEQLRLRREKFELEVEQMLETDGTLTEEEMGQLEQDRQRLGISKDNAELIISQVAQRERRKRPSSEEV